MQDQLAQDGFRKPPQFLITLTSRRDDFSINIIYVRLIRLKIGILLTILTEENFTLATAAELKGSDLDPQMSDHAVCKTT